MPNYIRDKTPGGTYFFTLVTYKRIPIFIDGKAVQLLKAAFSKVKSQYPFKISAIVVLPEHLHIIMEMNENDSDYSRRISKVKKEFGNEYLRYNAINPILSASLRARKERGIWQRRFWEHKIKSLEDYKAHIDYIHYNPVKHKLAESIADWRWSSYFKYRARGFYTDDWGSKAPADIKGAEWD